MNLILAVMLCSLANDYSVDLTCESSYTATDDCAESLRELKEAYLHTEKFVKLESCVRKIEHSRIHVVPLTKEWAKVRIGKFGAPSRHAPAPPSGKQNEDFENWLRMGL